MPVAPTALWIEGADGTGGPANRLDAAGESDGLGGPNNAGASIVVDAEGGLVAADVTVGAGT